MANDFARADIISAWRFESGALATDVKGANSLTLVNTPTEDTTNMMEGSCCISLAAASAQYAKIVDGDLSAGFPLKSGDAVKLISFSCWVRPTTVDTNKRLIVGKFQTASGKRTFKLYHNSTQIYFAYGTTSAASTEVSLAFGAMTANQKYHITITLDGINLCWWARIYNATAGTWYVKAGTLTAFYTPGDSDFRIGADNDLAANCQFNGQIDEFIVSNTWLHNSEAVAIKSGTFPVTGNYIYDYLYDPTDGNDTNDGFSSWAKAWKTWKKAFYPGDIILGLKEVETAQTGTVTATTGSVSVATTNDLTGSLAQYAVIRFGTDPTVYMVKAITSSVITLYRPYRGTTGSGKTLYKLTVPNVTSSDGNPTAYTGTASLPIIFKGGINSSTMDQDGFTIVTEASLGNQFSGSNLTWWNISNFGALYFNYGAFSGILTDCIITKLFLFRATLSAVGTWIRVTVNGIVVEESIFPNGLMYNCVINDPETASSAGKGLFISGATLDVIISRWKNAGYLGASAMALALDGRLSGIRFVDAVLDELNSGGKQIQVANSADILCKDVVFHNPTIGSGTLLTIASTSYLFAGKIRLVNVNGSATDHRTFVGAGLGVTVFHTLTPDYDVYNTAAPSSKILLAAGGLPFYIRHHIPCDPGVAKTISIYLRKNSTYGSSNLPFMRLRWITGAPPNIVHNVHDVPMTDVNDIFQQVSYEITPSIQGSIIMEIYGQSTSAGATIWYDDWSVV